MSPLEIREPPGDLPEYDRGDWKHWVDADRDCQDARVEALVAESTIAVGFTDSQECKVATGRWVALYTGAVVEIAGDLDMDHMVPLKNAHLSGGWAWNAQRKQDYANNLTYEDHLIGVTASANRSKGARGPEGWKPPDTSYWCEYAVDWIIIKAEWGLSANPAEWAALEEMLGTCAVDVVIEGALESTSLTPTPTALIEIQVASGGVFITEIMANPSAVNDAEGEWFEIYNSSADSSVDMNGWTLRDQGSNTHTINNPGPLMVSPGGYLVLGKNSDPTANGGVSVDYKFGSGFSLTNSDDEIELVDAEGNLVDSVTYDSDLVFTGASTNLDLDAFNSEANDIESNWCQSVSVMASGDRGTPGSQNERCP